MTESYTVFDPDTGDTMHVPKVSGNISEPMPKHLWVHKTLDYVSAVPEAIWDEEAQAEMHEYMRADLALTATDELVTMLYKARNRIAGQIGIGLAKFGDADLVTELDASLAKFKTQGEE